MVLAGGLPDYVQSLLSGLLTATSVSDNINTNTHVGLQMYGILYLQELWVEDAKFCYLIMVTNLLKKTKIRYVTALLTFSKMDKLFI